MTAAADRPATAELRVCRCTWPGAVPLPETCPSCGLPMMLAAPADVADLDATREVESD